MKKGNRANSKYTAVQTQTKQQTMENMRNLLLLYYIQYVSFPRNTQPAVHYASLSIHFLHL